MIDVTAYGGDPIRWADAVRQEARAMGIEAYFDSCCGYIRAASTEWERRIFEAACFSDMKTVRAALDDLERQKRHG